MKSSTLSKKLQNAESPWWPLVACDTSTWLPAGSPVSMAQSPKSSPKTLEMSELSLLMAKATGCSKCFFPPCRILFQSHVTAVRMSLSSLCPPGTCLSHYVAVGCPSRVLLVPHTLSSAFSRPRLVCLSLGCPQFRRRVGTSGSPNHMHPSTLKSSPCPACPQQRSLPSLCSLPCPWNVSNLHSSAPVLCQESLSPRPV